MRFINLILFQKEKHTEYYEEVLRDRTLRKSEVTPIIEKYALLVYEAEGRKDIKTVVDDTVIEHCTLHSTLIFKSFFMMAELKKIDVYMYTTMYSALPTLDVRSLAVASRPRQSETE